MLDFYFFLTAVPAVLLFGISKGGFAGPIAILSIPLMSLAMSPQTAAGILLPILLVMDFVALYIYWKKWDLKNIKIIIPSSIIGIIVGTFTFSFVSDDGIRIIIGIIAILFIFLSVIQKNSFLIKPTNTKGFFWSLIAGYTSFLIHAGGTPINFYLLPQNLNKTIYMGTMTIVFLIINSIKLIPYYYLGQLDLPNLKASIILSPLAPISILIGYYLHKKVTGNTFYYFIYFFLGVGGIKLIYDGIF